MKAHFFFRVADTMRALIAASSAILIAVGCSQASIHTPPPPSPTDHAAISTPTPTMPTSTAVPTSSPQPSATPTMTITPTPTTFRCDTETLLFQASRPQSGLYLICVDGSAVEQVFQVQEPSVISDFGMGMSFAVTVDGKRLAFASYSGWGERSTIHILDLRGGELVTLDSTNQPLGKLSWSADGEYLGYGKEEIYEPDILEIVHLDTLTKSLAVITDETLPGRDQGLYDFDWSPVGGKALYIISHHYQQTAKYYAYLAEIDCDPLTHQCRLESQQRFNWPHLRVFRMSWSHDASLIIVSGYDHTSDEYLIEIRRPGGELVRQINLTTSFPGIAPSVLHDVVLSPDGQFLAFVGRDESALSYGDIFVIDIDGMNLTNLTKGFTDTEDAYIGTVVWLPAQ